MMRQKPCAALVVATVGTIWLPCCAAAQAKRSAAKKATGAAVTKCGEGVTLSVSPARAVQGSLVLAEVKSSNNLVSVKGNWNGREVGFWNEGAASPASKTDRWRGLLGVDLEKPAGVYELTVFVTREGSDAVGCGAKVTVVVGRFPTERLTVDNQFVEPSPEQVQRAEEEAEKLRKIYGTATPERLWHGKFRLPLDNVTTGGNFGRRRILNGTPRSPHSGVDFPAPTGTPVHATQAGRVVLAEALFFAGNAVVVDHGLGIYTFYCHLSAIDVKAGDEVEAGTVLGEVGATGRVTGPHLHWGLSVNRDRANAMELVRVLGAR